MATANFEYIILTNRLVYFIDKSVDAISWKWTIEGEENFNQHPDHTFSIGGPHEITLLINEGEPDEDEITRTIHVPTFTEYNNTTIPGLYARGIPTAQTYQWYKRVSGEEVEQSGATSREYEINNVSPDHQGDYFCRITNTTGSVDSDDATLTVRISPYFYDVSETQEVFGETTVVLHAFADGIPTQLYYQWYKNGEYIYNDDKYSGTQTAELTITDISEAEAGNYTCLVTNDLSQQAGTDIITITVLDPTGSDCPLGQTFFYDDCEPAVDAAWTVSTYGGNPFAASINDRYQSNASLAGEFGNDIGGTLTKTGGTTGLSQMDFHAFGSISYDALAGSVGSGFNRFAAMGDDISWGGSMIVGLEYRVTQPSGLRFQIRIVFQVGGVSVYSLDVLDVTKNIADFPYSFSCDYRFKVVQNGANLDFYVNDIYTATKTSYTLQNAPYINLYYTDSNGLKATGSYIKGAVDNVRLVASSGLPTSCAGLPAFDESYWVCSDDFDFNGVTIDQIGDKPYATRYIENIAGLIIAYTGTWKDSGGVSVSGNVCYNGIGVKPYNGIAPDCGIAAEIDGTGAYGAWQLRTSACFSSKTTSFIGRNNSTEYGTGCLLDTGVEYTSNILITVSEDLGGHTYDITVRLIIAAAGVDETRVISGINFPDGNGQIMLAGLYLNSVDDTLTITQLDILEAA